jgi:hypothetical protein
LFCLKISKQRTVKEMDSFTQYKPRKVEFNQLLTLDGWQVKVYTITHRAAFASDTILTNAVASLPQWLEQSTALGLPTYNTAFLIVHEGRDGVWSLISWWIGGEMLQSLTYFTRFDQPHEFVRLPQEGFMACVWEMAVMSFERAMWIEYVLKKAEEPDFTSYWQKYLSKEV